MKKIINLIAVCMLASSAVTAAEKKNTFGRDFVKIDADPVLYKYMQAVISNIDEKRFSSPVKMNFADPYSSYKYFCYGGEPDYADIVAGPRPMTKEEFDRCNTRNIGDVIQLKIGYDAIVLATKEGNKQPVIDEADLYKALAMDVPLPDKNVPNRMTANPYQRWSDINKDSVDIPIKILGPGDGTQDAYSVRDLAMEKGCRTWEWIAKQKYIQKIAAYYRAYCYNTRKDGRYHKTKAGDKSIQEKLRGDKEAVGLINYNEWKKDNKGLKVIPVEGISPTDKSISKEVYPLSRALYVYVKVSAIKDVQGIAYVLNELASEDALKDGGYLSKMGLVAMSDDERKEVAEEAKQLKGMRKAP